MHGERDHWAVLSGTRFVLALIVANAHFGLALAPGEYHGIHALGRSFGVLAAIVGFIMISGFSIAHSIEQQPRGFYLRRVGRIAPVLLLATALHTGLLVVYGPLQMQGGAYAFGAPEWWKVAATALGINAVVGGNFLGPAWSLSVEILFYIAAPALLLMPRVALAGLIGVSVAFYAALPLLEKSSLPGLKYGLAAAALFWAWGLGFMLWRERGSPIIVTALLVSGVGLLQWFNYEGGQFSAVTIVVTVSALAFGGVYAIHPHIRKLLSWLGDVSYPMFLLHWPLFVLLAGSGVKRYSIFMGGALIVSALALHYVDRPLRRRIANMAAKELIISAT